jgi:hypothetical protein
VVSAGIDPRLEGVIAGGIPRRFVDVVAVHCSALEPVALSLVRITDPPLLGVSLCDGIGDGWAELQLDVDGGFSGGGSVWIYGEGAKWVAFQYGRGQVAGSVRATFRGQSQVFPVVQGLYLVTFWPTHADDTASEDERVWIQPP